MGSEHPVTTVARHGAAEAGRSPLPTAPDDSGALPMDRQLDRRAFLHRMTAITAAVSTGSALYPVGPLHAATGAAAAVVAPPGPPRLHPAGSPASSFRWPLRLPDPAAIVFDSPADLTIAEAAALIESGRLSPVELTRACLERIEELDDVYQAFNTVLYDRAMEEARRLAGEPWSGPLHGIPLAIKDNYFTAGVLTTANSHIFRDFVPGFDATAVQRLRAAGGIVLGKTQMGPLATSRATTPDGENTTLNAWAPHDGEISPGGSSSGSATAVAARMATSSIGTQTGGSITGPSSEQGLTGLKPTMGRVSLYGVIPLTYTRDHPGPLARDARDAAIMLQAMAGPDPKDPRTQRLAPVADYVAAAEPVRREGRTVAALADDHRRAPRLHRPPRADAPPRPRGVGGGQAAAGAPRGGHPRGPAADARHLRAARCAGRGDPGAAHLGDARRPGVQQRAPSGALGALP